MKNQIKKIIGAMAVGAALVSGSANAGLLFVSNPASPMTINAGSGFSVDMKWDGLGDLFSFTTSFSISPANSGLDWSSISTPFAHVVTLPSTFSSSAAQGGLLAADGLETTLATINFFTDLTAGGLYEISFDGQFTLEDADSALCDYKGNNPAPECGVAGNVISVNVLRNNQGNGQVPEPGVLGLLGLGLLGISLVRRRKA